MRKFRIIFVLIILLISESVFCQKIENTVIKEKIAEYKKDPKGPYQQIMWYCPDGSRVPPQQRCPEKGGVQRATYKVWVETLGQTNHIYIGQILSATDFETFLDKPNQFSRLKQYQLENYIKAVDNGWISRKARFYRGAFQDEDENAWGVKFLSQIISDETIVQKNFFMLRQAFKDIPHKSKNSNITKVRALSLEVADSVASFMNLRIKIHGQPDATDLQQVKEFNRKSRSQMSSVVQAKTDELIREMEILYKPADWQILGNFINSIGQSTPAGQMVQKAVNDIIKSSSPSQKISIAATLIIDIRKSMVGALPKSKMALFDLSNKTEELIFKELPNWKVLTLSDLLQKNYVLSMAAVGAGFIELWEWNVVSKRLNPPLGEEITLGQLTTYLTDARSVVEWSTGMIRAAYGDVVNLFSGFEPLASGFPDDRIRSSVLLQLGQNVGLLGNFIGSQSSITNKVFNIENQSHIRGLNPGFAKGELIVTVDQGNIEISANKIYVFDHAPADLKPVAGIATVSEGNLVSHVQLLARNLAIPNAVISEQNLSSLKIFQGEQIFYAVSKKGNVVMKKADDMTPVEKALFEVKKRSEEKVRVPVDKIDLSQQKVLNLRNVNSAGSGKLYGPKAANLGQLKLMFPDHVVEGIVIPFGIFRAHFEQKMPGSEITYWQFLNKTFKDAEAKQKEGIPKTETDKFILKQLEILREAILKMPLQSSFISDFKTQFLSVLGKKVGEIPVFLRSDTNMEDLKDFTGAGLNLTLFNVLEEEKIWQGIKQVWASPYSERSFQWRQSYLLNPENIFPSILVIPGVNNDYSGVLITKGVSSGNDSDLTIAFSRGAGGAVEGQAAETYLLKSDGTDLLLAPSREPSFNSLSEKGGTQKEFISFVSPILNKTNLNEIRDFSKELKQKMAETRSMQGPYDVELGFLNNKLWLFQVRPFVENKNAAGATYLESITPKIDESKRIKLSSSLN